MAKPANLIGKRFGALTVKERTENNVRGNTMWLCRCDCGNDFVALGYDLTHGRTTSCGCRYGQIGKPSANRISLVGEKFGKLTVVDIDEEKSKNGKLVWRCACDCGNRLSVAGGNLKSGHTKSCGCSKRNIHSRNFKDLTGMKFGRLTVLREDKARRKKIYWECVCECGNKKVISGDCLKTGRTKSCGCLDKENRARAKAITHGMSKTRLYAEWISMKNRCSSNYHESKNYFKKGISVCKAWRKFEVFAEWAMKNGYKDGLTLDRIDNNKGYSPDNCRWATMKEQENNRSNNVIIEYMGESKTMKQWCDCLGLNYGMVKARKRKGWKVPRLFEPPHKNQYQ
ncbi:MAG: hypothetical protein HFH72_08810 [Lachnospiraceae bacterium]|nr:hypothetical protein [Lachnospiraceae bacterium]